MNAGRRFKTTTRDLLTRQYGYRVCIRGDSVPFGVNDREINVSNWGRVKAEGHDRRMAQLMAKWEDTFEYNRLELIRTGDDDV